MYAICRELILMLNKKIMPRFYLKNKVVFDIKIEVISYLTGKEAITKVSFMEC